MRDSLIKLMPWMGGKGQLMWAIQMLLPIHYKTLVDVFGGSGIITLNTAVPKGCLQIYNDLNHDLYNLLFCVKHRPMALTKELSFLPINARDEFDVLRRQLQGEDFTQLYLDEELQLAEQMFPPPEAEEVKRLLQSRAELSDVRRAAAIYKLQRYSYNGNGDSYGVSSCDIQRFFRDIWECSHRLKDVALENTKNAAGLVTYVTNAWTSGWGYVWGTYGQTLTPELLQYKLTQYPDGVGKYAAFIRANWLGKPTADCVGLIKGYGWLSTDTMTIDYGTHGMPDIGANEMYYTATQRGSIDTMSDTPGLAVWKSGHIGVYIGNGEVIEAMGTKYGVVKTQLEGRGWTHWLEVPGVEYE